MHSISLATLQVPSKEYQIKAVFIYNFTQFVEWPSNAFEEGDSPLVIGILGDDPFGSYLDETVKNEKMGQHQLVIQRFQKVDEIKTCHILFVNIADRRQLDRVFEKIKDQNILTVGDASDFEREGGMIRFFTENNKIRIRINLEATKNAELSVSSKLLRLAEIVSPQNN